MGLTVFFQIACETLVYHIILVSFIFFLGFSSSLLCFCFVQAKHLSLLRLLPRQVIRSNNFAISPVLVTTPTLDGATVRFQAGLLGLGVVLFCVWWLFFFFVFSFFLKKPVLSFWLLL